MQNTSGLIDTLKPIGNGKDRVIVHFAIWIFLTILPSDGFGQSNFWEQTDGPAGGSLFTLTVDSHGRLYAGSHMNGVFISSDGGAHWRQSGLTTRMIRALAVDSNDQIFAGTSDSGVYRSSDAGTTWRKFNNGLTNEIVLSLAINSDQHLFAATSGSGVFRSTDHGDSWLRVDSGLTCGFVRTIVVDHLGKIFAGTFTSDRQGVYVSTDNGTSWRTSGLTNPEINCLVVTQQNHIFAATNGEGIFRSTDSGASWTQVANGLGNAYFSSIAADSVGNLYAGTPFTLPGLVGVFFSSDNGNTWVYRSGTTWDIKTLATYRTTTLFCGTFDDGLMSSTDLGLTWRRLSLQNTIVSALAFKPPNLLFATDYHAGVVCRTTDRGSTWLRSFVGDWVYSLAVNFNGTVFAGGFRRGLFRSTDEGATWAYIGFYPYCIYALATRQRDDAVFAAVLDLEGAVLGIWKSSDDGVSWNQIGLSNYWVTALLITHEGNIIVGTSAQGILRSLNDGDTWSPINTGLGDLSIRALVQDSSNTLYTGTGTGVFRSINNGETWQAVNSGLTTLSVRTMVADLAGAIYCAAWNYGEPGKVFRSTNRCDSWLLINSGLTTPQIMSFGISSDGYVYAGSTGSGMFRSAKSTTAYDPASLELPMRFSLDQNFPNPFNPRTRIRYSIPTKSNVEFTIYNLLGQRITTLMNEIKEPGSYEVEWNADGLSSGIYFCRMQAGVFTASKKLVMIR